LAIGRSPQVVDLLVGEPDLVLVAVGGFDTHYDSFIFRNYRTRGSAQMGCYTPDFE
jgi:hypothetical protein